MPVRCQKRGKDLRAARADTCVDELREVVDRLWKCRDVWRPGQQRASTGGRGKPSDERSAV